jgi:hypothetical protein
MKKLSISLVLFALSIGLFSCKKSQSDLATPETQTQLIKPLKTNSGGEVAREGGGTETCPTTTVGLIAGQHIDAGSVTVTNDANFIYVTYKTANGYVMTQTHLYVGNCELIPVNNAGNPVPGRFPYKTVQNNTTYYTCQVPISAIPAGVCGCIAAHAAVVKYGENGEVVDQQTAWGNGTAINPTGNWGMKFGYCSCPTAP